MITLTSFSEWMMRTYTSFLRDPSLVRDSYDALRHVSPDEIVLMTPQGDGDAARAGHSLELRVTCIRVSESGRTLRR